MYHREAAGDVVGLLVTEIVENRSVAIEAAQPLDESTGTGTETEIAIAIVIVIVTAPGTVSRTDDAAVLLEAEVVPGIASGMPLETETSVATAVATEMYVVIGAVIVETGRLDGTVGIAPLVGVARSGRLD